MGHQMGVLVLIASFMRGGSVVECLTRGIEELLIRASPEAQHHVLEQNVCP